MKKILAIITPIIACAVILSSCGNNNHKEKEPTVVTPVPNDLPKEDIVKEKWVPVHTEFNPAKIEVVNVNDNKKFIDWPGEGGDWPSLANSFRSRIELHDSMSRIYSIEINGYQILKQWHNAGSEKDLVDKNLDKNFDSTDTYSPAKKAYDIIISSKAGEIRIFVDTLNKGGSPKIMVISGQKLIQKKIGNAYLKDQYENILYEYKY